MIEETMFVATITSSHQLNMHFDARNYHTKDVSSRGKDKDNLLTDRRREVSIRTRGTRLDLRLNARLSMTTR